MRVPVARVAPHGRADLMTFGVSVVRVLLNGHCVRTASSAASRVGYGLFGELEDLVGHCGARHPDRPVSGEVSRCRKRARVIIKLNQHNIVGGEEGGMAGIWVLLRGANNVCIGDVVRTLRRYDGESGETMPGHR
jgi:hypothetical protein